MNKSFSFSFTFFRLIVDDEAHRIEKTKPGLFSITLSLSLPLLDPLEQRKRVISDM